MAGINTPIVRGRGTLLRGVENRTTSHVVKFSDGTDRFSLDPKESTEVFYKTGTSVADAFRVESSNSDPHPNISDLDFLIWQDSNGTPGEKLNISQLGPPNTNMGFMQSLTVLKDYADYKMVIQDIGMCIEDVSVDGPGFAFSGVSERYFHVFYCNGTMNAIPSKICETSIEP